MIDPDVEAGWRMRGLRGGESLAEAFAKAAALRPDATLHIHSATRAGSYTLGALHARGLRLSRSLAALGVGPGDVVALQLPNWVEAALVWQAAAALGCIVLPIVTIYGPSELDFLLRDSRASIIFVARGWGKIDPLASLRTVGPLGSLRAIVTVGGAADPAAIGWDAFCALDGPVSDNARHPGDPAFLVYTSGTTAAPKGVVHSSESLLAEVRQMHAADDADGPVLSPYPSGHVAGALGMLNHAVAARDTHLFDTWDPRVGARTIAQHRVSAMSGTPFHYLGLLDAADEEGHDLRSLVACGTGGATVPEALVRRAQEHGLALYRRYGMSEHPTVTQGRRDDPLETRMTTDGRPLPGVEIRIVDDAGVDLPIGAEGEVATRGPDMFLGYRDPQATAAALLPGGWFLSGDIGRLDADGNLAITDRKKDIIIRGGENISSREVEEVMLGIDGVVEVAAVGMPDDRLGERVCVYVSLVPGAAIDLPVVQRAFAERGMARQKTPERVVVATDFPRTAAGKIRKADLRMQLRQEGRP